ncbi:hypothetical protein SOVF_073800 [Spinacia oleracea]|nr:hypothetical protein SOVF_073800 [Spinacia oleracea]
MIATSSGVVILWSLMSLFITCIALDTIPLGKSIRDGTISETLVSANGDFELGFFSPGNSGRRYVGIWFKKIPVPTVVWVANREDPLVDSSGVLQLNNNSLVLYSSTRHVLWYSNSTIKMQNPVAQLLDSGNLVVRDEDENNPDNFLWQSFDYPCDTLLPGMKLGRDLVTGIDRFLTSWKSSDDPSPGSYTYQMDSHGYPQPFVFRDNSVELFRDGPWNGVWFSGTAMLPDDSLVEFVLNNKEMYYTYEMGNIPTRRTLTIDGNIQRLNWNDDTKSWTLLYTKPNDKCDSFAPCGSFGICSVTNLECECLKGFVPKSLTDWNEREQYRDGCVRNGPFNCSIDNGFIKYPNVKLPDTRSCWYNTTMTLKECKNKCLQNCSCTAYANVNVKDKGSGCLLWFGALLDVKDLTGPGQDLFVRVSSDSGGGKKGVWMGVGSSLSGVLLICGATIFVLRQKRRKGRR